MFRCAVFMLLLLVAGCQRDPILARIGRFSVRASDAAFRDQIIRVYQPAETRSLGLKQLVDAFIDAQILVDNGYALDDRRLLEEEARIDRTTLAPETLGRIKAIFGSDRERYRRVYVLPVLVARVIHYEFFQGNEALQASSLAAARAALEQAQQTSLKKLAHRTGGELRRLRVSVVRGLEWDSTDASVRAPSSDLPPLLRRRLAQLESETVREQGQRWVKEVAAPLRDGEVFGKVLDFGERWGVVQRLGKAKDAYRLQALLLPKASFENWYQNARRKITPLELPNEMTLVAKTVE